MNSSAVRHPNLPPMIAMTKDQAKHRFAARLNELLDEMGVPERGRRQWLSRRFNAAFSPEAARKWLEAETMPDQPHFSMLCTAFKDTLIYWRELLHHYASGGVRDEATDARGI